MQRAIKKSFTGKLKIKFCVFFVVVKNGGFDRSKVMVAIMSKVKLLIEGLLYIWYFLIIKILNILKYSFHI